MDIKDAKAKLADLKNINLRINAKKQELNRVIRSREFLTGLKLKELKDSLQRRYIDDSQVITESLTGLEKRYVITIERITKELGELLDTKDMLCAVMAELSYESEKLLTLRYINRRQWVSIACEMHYSERQVYYLHKKALSEFAEMFERHAALRQEEKTPDAEQTF